MRGILDRLNVGHLAALPFLTCCTCSLMLNRGVGRGNNMVDEFNTVGQNGSSVSKDRKSVV